MENGIVQLVIQAVRNRYTEMEYPGVDGVNENTLIFGKGGCLDSLDIIALVAELEERIEAEFGIQTALADEQAMNMEPSPFQNVLSLSDHIDRLLKQSRS